MVRGTFANVRLRNLMLPPDNDGKAPEGGLSRCFLDAGAPVVPLFDAAMRYRAAGVPTMVFAGEEYGTGSSRDWAAKGTLLLGIRAVVARSFERIHRANLIGMGVLPLEFTGSDSAQTLGLTGAETFDLEGIGDPPTPRQMVTLVIHDGSDSCRRVPLRLRIDTQIEVAYFQHDGILPYVLRKIIGQDGR